MNATLLFRKSDMVFKVSDEGVAILTSIRYRSFGIPFSSYYRL